MFDLAVFRLNLKIYRIENFTMLRIIAFFVSIIISTGLSAQYDYEISGNTEAVKHGYKVAAHMLRSAELKWGAIESQCFEQPAKYGLWLNVSKLKSNQIKVTVLSGKQPSFVSKPKFYFGKVEQIGKDRRLTEVICRSFTEEAQEYSFEVLGLDPAVEYWMLVATDAPDKMFGLEVTEKFEASPTPEVTESVKEPRNSIIGQIRTINGESKKGVVVTLIGENDEELATTSTEEDGSFQFTELPKDQVYLLKLEETDTELLVDVFMQNQDGNVTSRARKNERGLYDFRNQKKAFNDLKLLTKADWTMNVAEGKTGVMGRVVDDRRAPDLAVRQDDLHVVRRRQLRDKQVQVLHRARGAADIHVLADLVGAEQDQHETCRQIR